MNVQRLTLTAICIAIVTVFVAYIPFPTVVGGYNHPGAVAEVFIAVAFGPIVGGIAAGVGALIADLILAPQFAIMTLIAHGIMGFLIGYFGWRKGQWNKIIGLILGGLALAVIYYIGEIVILGFRPVEAAAEIIPNLFQVALGLLGLLLYELVKRAYPQIDQLAGKPAFQER